MATHACAPSDSARKGRSDQSFWATGSSLLATPNQFSTSGPLGSFVSVLFDGEAGWREDVPRVVEIYDADERYEVTRVRHCDFPKYDPRMCSFPRRRARRLRRFSSTLVQALLNTAMGDEIYENIYIQTRTFSAESSL